MAITVSGTAITFNDGTAQATAPVPSGVSRSSVISLAGLSSSTLNVTGSLAGTRTTAVFYNISGGTTFPIILINATSSGYSAITAGGQASTANYQTTVRIEPLYTSIFSGDYYSGQIEFYTTYLTTYYTCYLSINSGGSALDVSRTSGIFNNLMSSIRISPSTGTFTGGQWFLLYG